ncbi:MAG: AmmeMemoRadiSam system protein A [Xanthomonadales bacterium]|nr:AmmeMemoRadiSam system protein A [Xanthomonadales bacterium]
MTRLDPAAVDLLFQESWAVIHDGAAGVRRAAPDPNDFPPPLQSVQSSFVTLSRSGELRGCCGRLEATRPLVVDVAANAWATAFSDPRFPPVGALEIPELTMELSVLSPLVQLEGVHSREQLLGALRPGVDGLVISEGPRRATFLPKVWESLPDPGQFIDHLLLKGGFTQWPSAAEFYSYHTDLYDQVSPVTTC